ncbi:MaoC domain-containing protein dehydratase [Acidovorax sp. NO-1]|jgi:acyl dehydratase|uniref:MaoC family dehydratase n=1 Tax=Acidovorax sp. NO-1 TaxID=512030 RepID=UPI00023FC697|nr:MaoC family dehydratase [Acidovorax sp. NO-1]EHL22002.1 MaoC domain-containing protein dehydratase [Acidovorax sp. NO-1]
MKFAEFHPGQVIHAGPYRVTPEESVAFAKAYDPQWFHTDAQAAQGGSFGGLITSGWHTCSIAMRLIVDVALQGSESFASPGLKYVRWPYPVQPGDELRLEAHVIAARRSESRKELGIIEWRWQLFNQEGRQVLDLEATSMFKLPVVCLPDPPTNEQGEDNT